MNREINRVRRLFPCHVSSPPVQGLSLGEVGGGVVFAVGGEEGLANTLTT
jgi:hypothetical protein